MPCSNASLVYYQWKLSSCNLTVFDHNTKCYLWSEIDGNRGSREIGTRLIKTMLDVPPVTQHVTHFSDYCGGQNRNRYISAGLLYVVKNSNIRTVEQKILETGHTHMEVDATQLANERSKKTTCGWFTAEPAKNFYLEATNWRQFNAYLVLHGQTAINTYPCKCKPIFHTAVN